MENILEVSAQLEEEHAVTIDTARFPEEDEDEAHPHAPLSSAHSSVCDRRISRAARSLLHRHLTAILAFQNDDNPSVWQLLETSLAPSAYQGRCPLVPSRDLLKYHEEKSIVLTPPPKRTISKLGISTRNALYTITKRNWLTTSMYQCGFCGKVFTTRYYLDRHLDEHHSHELVEQRRHFKHNKTPDNLLCPATAWCPALPFCSQYALELEPYYGPGSAGLSPADRSHVHRDLWNADQSMLEGCDDQVMKQSQLQCHHMMQDCFGENSQVGDYLQHTLCESINCPDRLHQMFFAATTRSNEAVLQMRKQVHEWQDEWEDYYAEHHTLGRMGTLFLVVMMLAYGRYAWKSMVGSPAKALQKKHPKGTRLLQKKGASSSWWKRARKTLGLSHSKAKNKSKVH